MTWLLIDGNNWFAQCQFASPQSGQQNFMHRLKTLLGQVEHSRAVVCWDQGVSWRRELFPQYKDGRNGKPPGFQEALQATQLETSSYPHVESIGVEGFEADDLLATFTAIALAEGERVVNFSQDKDLHQLLVKGSVSQVLTVKRLTHIKLQFDPMTADRLFEIYGSKPWQWVDYRCIVGDKSDGIDGCDGLGEKAATALMLAYPSLDDFFARPFDVDLKPGQRTRLMNVRPQLELKRKLMKLVDDVPIPEKYLVGAAS